MGERYKGIIETLYKDEEKAHLDMTITYEDGRTQRIKTDLRIQEVGSSK